MKCCCYLRDDQDLLANGKSQNERRFWGIFLGHAFFAGGILEEDILIAEIEELEELDASETYPRRLNAKEVFITQKEGEFIFLWQMVQQNYQDETTNSKNPLWDGNPPWGERISTENLTATGKSFDLKNKKMTQTIGSNCWSTQGFFI